MRKQNEYSLKKALIALMLCLYVFGLIKPTLPLVKDVFAHSFFKAAHLATVHLENGKYHLHLELNDETKKSDSKQNAISSFEVLAAHTKVELLLLAPFVQPSLEINSPYTNISTDVIIPTPLLPPEC